MDASQGTEQRRWWLDSAVQRHFHAPDTFLISTETERCALQKGDLAKLLFVLPVEDEAGDLTEQHERMWVEVVERRDDGGYVGELKNQPWAAGVISRGELVAFMPDHVAAVE